MKTSVALCTYNGENYLSRQLESIFRQSHTVDEIVVCDDGSTDSTLSILEAFQRLYPNILFIHKNAQNLGGRKNFEKCFGLCSGDVIFFSDQDDIWHSDKVKKTISWFAEEESCWAIATDARLIGEAGQDLQRSFWQSFDFSVDELTKMPTEGLCEFVLRYHNIVAGAMLAVRKEAKDFIYPFHFPQDIWHDEWMAVVLSGIGRMKLIDEKLVDYRLHSGQQAGVGKDSTDLLSWVRSIKEEGRFSADPQFYLNHASYTYRKLREIQSSAPFLDLAKLEESLRDRLQDAKKVYLKREPFFLRKAKLLKWFMERRFTTSLRDVLAI